ncbi:hypothetical protein JCM11641_003662 [Rhodosporidiobolus odoratus]
MSFVNRLIHGPDSNDRRPPVEPKRKLKLLISYAPDWILSIVLLGVIGYLTNKAGYKREFSLSDASIQHTYATTERISFAMCIVYAGVIPAVSIILVALIWRRSFWDLHNGLLGLLQSVAITTVFTQVVKICVGRPRPDLIDRCQPIANATNSPVYGLAVASKICTTDINSNIMLDGFRSFPSGHSSFAWAGLGFFALYLSGKMHLFDRRGHTFKAWIAITPPIGATLIAVSRTMDYRHHATDVIAGSILGAVIALLTYHLYYPSLFSSQCHLPYSPRIPPTLPHDQLSATSPSHNKNNKTANALLPIHRFSTSSTNSAEQEEPSPITPNQGGIRLEQQQQINELGETAARPSGRGGRKGEGRFYEGGERERRY